MKRTRVCCLSHVEGLQAARFPVLAYGDQRACSIERFTFALLVFSGI